MAEPNETLIINQIIQELDLDLSPESDLTQVIQQIKKLIKVKPPVVVNQINQPQDTPFGESLAEIMEVDLFYLTQNWNLTAWEIESLKKATNYKELSQIRNKLLEQYYKGRQSVNNNNSLIKSQPPLTSNPWPERSFWIILLLISYLLIIGLVVRLKNRKKMVVKK
ncbi:MAG: hypothetical protein I3273_04600 [Candidatus Moeniiplasma glomeromycotorum]|nr:hypothetical protein [Candidatus Moeniiplasma glomeromycotorum]MCE8169375.1 hypothetical protein [Candidatus Moeniiplasma glomeromycotorum]